MEAQKHIEFTTKGFSPEASRQAAWRFRLATGVTGWCSVEPRLKQTVISFWLGVLLVEFRTMYAPPYVLLDRRMVWRARGFDRWTTCLVQFISPTCNTDYTFKRGLRGFSRLQRRLVEIWGLSQTKRKGVLSVRTFRSERKSRPELPERIRLYRFTLHRWSRNG